MDNKTAMQELISRISSLHKTIPTNTSHNRAVKGAFAHAISIMQEYISKERQQIEEAHQNGFYCGNDVANGLLPEHSSSSDYYNQTYTQKQTKSNNQ